MRRITLSYWFPALLLVLAGCASSVDVETVDNSVLPQWPPSPLTARVSYLYSVKSPSDMNISRGFFGKAWQFVKGEAPARLTKPQGIYVDESGRMYVVDSQQAKIHVFDSQKSRYFSFPEKPHVNFRSPVDVVADNRGRVYVSDSSASVIHVFDELGKNYLTSFGLGQLTRPTGLAIRPETGELLVVDTLAATILIFDTDDFSLKMQTVRNAESDSALHYPTNIALAPDGSVYITDSLNFRIQILKDNLQFENQFGEAGDSPGFFSRPKGVAVDSDSNIYVVDALFDNVQIFNRSGELLMAFGTSGNAPGEFWLPSDIHIDSMDRVYVSDSYNSRVQVFQYRGQDEQP